ncbi:MAG: hypothetical protein EFT35_03425 [Methanophagales archaeon ANME-1-THS]|nr:MAG: hypothetical protein EFT35_03425 [Methanophagales archaeon ANME-1-THS]
MKKRHVSMLMGLLCLTGIVYAQVSPNFDLSWNVIGGGGGPMSSANYRVDSTVGQIIGVSESSNYKLSAGYWYGVKVQPQGLCGDVNCDHSVDIGDVTLVLNHWANPAKYPLNCDEWAEWAGDVTCDEAIDIGDVTLLLNHWANPGKYPLNCCPS